MTDWSGGYPSQNRYPDTIQTLSTPIGIDIGLLAQGRARPHRGGSYRYCEMGCGTAFSMTALAAANPQSTFVGYDFMPEHVVRAMSLIEEGELSNITIHESSFEELATGPAPEPFDYIVLHGVWSWVSEENQAHLAEILGRWLKPGGIAYLGYSAAAGWMTLAPLRRIFQDAPEGARNDRYGPARAAVEALIKLNPDSEIARKWSRYSKLPDSYLSHDLGAKNASAHWHVEIAAALVPAKLAYLSPTDLIEQLAPLSYSPAQMEFIEKAMSEGWGETARDLATESNFRCDLYGRGTPLIPAAKARRSLGALVIASWRPLLAAEQQFHEECMEQPWGEDVSKGIEVAFSQGDVTIGEFVEKLGVEEKPGLQMALALIARQEANVVRPMEEVTVVNETLAPFLAALKRRYRDGDVMPGVASARLMGPVQLSGPEKEALFGDGKPDKPTAQGLARLALPKV